MVFGATVDATLLNELACSNLALKFASGIFTICALVIVEKAITKKRNFVFIYARINFNQFRLLIQSGTVLELYRVWS
ncbi:hypothetical protein D3C87_2093130 [compost metagenome]